MSIERLKEEFIDMHKDYRNDINNFFLYLEKARNIPIIDKNIEFALGAIETEGIKESLKFLIDRGIYGKQETARKYAVAVGKFFEYVRDYTSIKNKDLFDEISANLRTRNSYIGRMNSYIEQLADLKPKEPLRILSKDQALKLLERCEKQLNQTETWESEIEFKKAGAAIGIKIMLVFGVTYRQLRVIQISQVKEDIDTIELNGFNLRIPVRLSKQIYRYIQYKKDHGIKNESDFLLTNRDGVEWGTISSSSGIPDILKTELNTTDITGIVKYGIFQMVSAGINDHIIKEITGAGNDLVAACVQLGKSTLIDEVNNKLVTVELYYDF